MRNKEQITNKIEKETEVVSPFNYRKTSARTTASNRNGGSSPKVKWPERLPIVSFAGKKLYLPIQY